MLWSENWYDFVQPTILTAVDYSISLEPSPTGYLHSLLLDVIIMWYNSSNSRLGVLYSLEEVAPELGTVDSMLR